MGISESQQMVEDELLLLREWEHIGMVLDEVEADRKGLLPLRTLHFTGRQ